MEWLAEGEKKLAASNIVADNSLLWSGIVNLSIVLIESERSGKIFARTLSGIMNIQLTVFRSTGDASAHCVDIFAEVIEDIGQMVQVEWRSQLHIFTASLCSY